MMKRRLQLFVNFLTGFCLSLLPISLAYAVSADRASLRVSVSTAGLFGGQGTSYYGSSMAGSRIGQTWQAVDTRGQIVRSQDQVAKLHLYYFGFTQCPDICPSGLANLSLLYEELSPEEQAQLQLVFVSIDPERDTPAIMQTYLANFAGDFMGLTGSPEQIAQMAQQFRVKYRKVPHATGYTMEHSSQFFLFDKKAQPRLFYHSDADAHKIAQDIRHILGE